MTPETLKHIRKSILKLSQAELGELLGYQLRQMGRFERGEFPIPPGVGFAVAWLAAFGPDDPHSDDWRPRWQRG